jgi:hypothetical protein
MLHFNVPAAWPCPCCRYVDIQHGYRHAAWTGACSIDRQAATNVYTHRHGHGHGKDMDMGMDMDKT